MKPSAIILTLALGVSAGNLSAQDPAGAAPPADRPPPPQGAAQGNPQQRPGGPRLLPPGAQEFLQLTAEQQKQVADLEAEVKAKLEKILTPEQLEKMKQMRPPQRPGGPGAAPGGPPRGPARGPDGGTPGPQGGQGNPDDDGGQAPPQGPPPEE